MTCTALFSVYLYCGHPGLPVVVGDVAVHTVQYSKQIIRVTLYNLSDQLLSYALKLKLGVNDDVDNVNRQTSQCTKEK